MESLRARRKWGDISETNYGLGNDGGGPVDYAGALTELTRGKLRPVYLLYGGEPFLEHELLGVLRRRLIPPEADAFNFHQFEAGPEQAAQAVGVAQTLPFFGEHRLVIMADCPLFAARRQARAGAEDGGEEPEKAGDQAERLLAYLERPAPHTVLAITAGESVDSRRKLTKAVMARGAVVECRALWPDGAARWCVAWAEQAGKRLDADAAALLVDKVGVDLRSLAGELDKLALYVGGAPDITEADVAAAAAGSHDVQTWDLVDALAERRTGAALTHLEQMLRAGEPTPLLIWHIGRHYHLLLQARAFAARGMSAEQAAARARQKPRYWQKLMSQARRFRREQLVAALERILDADLKLKTGHDPRLTLEALLVDLAVG